MSTWKHLFLTGEFRERADLLSGLTFEQVTQRPGGVVHSIYDELWHTAMWQRTVVEREKPVSGDYYPSAGPENEQQWHDVVRLFLDGCRAAIAWTESPDRLAQEVEPGVTMAEELQSLAVHNAYHLGKIVMLRQMIGAWPPRTETAEA